MLSYVLVIITRFEEFAVIGGINAGLLWLLISVDGDTSLMHLLSLRLNDCEFKLLTGCNDPPTPPPPYLMAVLGELYRF
jgi:hypothetical protein